MNAWAAFLASFERHFDVRGSLSAGLCSNCGFAEGCPLSVFFAMCLTDLAFHCYFWAFAPDIEMLSFVDNLGFNAGSGALVARGWVLMQAFCDMWQLDVDLAKTFAWGNTPDMRASLAPLGLPLLTGAGSPENDYGPIVAALTLERLWTIPRSNCSGQPTTNAGCMRSKSSVAWPSGPRAAVGL